MQVCTQSDKYMQLKPNSDALELILPYVPEFSQQEKIQMYSP